MGRAAETLLASYDTSHGGFGGDPKFPPSGALEFLLRFHIRTANRPALDGQPTACYCVDHACRTPTSDAARLVELMSTGAVPGSP